jgi:hypothetical protein
VHANDLGFADYTNTTSTSQVSNNDFVDNLWVNAQVFGVSSVWTDNVISGAPYGLFFTSVSGTESNVAMTHNIFRNNSLYAIYADGDANSGSLSATENQFVSNGGGSFVAPLTTANMTCNWWGSTTGPTTLSNPTGTGDLVTANAVSSPWAYSPTTYECGPATPIPTLAFGTNAVMAGGTTTLTLTLANSSAQPISNVSGSFTLPGGISISTLNANTCGGTPVFGSGQDVSFSGVQIPGGGNCVIVFDVAAGAAGNYGVTIPAGDIHSPRGDSTTATTASLIVDSAPQIDPIPACVGRELLITDVALAGNQVRVKGFARIKYAGQQVALRFQITGNRVVGYATVQSDGSWTTLLNRPARRLINSNSARYQAAIGGGKTSWIKLVRRMGSTNVAYGDGNFYVTGAVNGPLARGQRLNATISSGCQPYKLVAQMPVSSRNGRFSGVVPTKIRKTVVLARLNVRVRHSSRGRTTFSTYSILQPVVINTP